MSPRAKCLLIIVLAFDAVVVTAVAPYILLQL